jgi:hypothetical protein
MSIVLARDVESGECVGVNPITRIDIRDMVARPRVAGLALCVSYMLPLSDFISTKPITWAFVLTFSYSLPLLPLA